MTTGLSARARCMTLGDAWQLAIANNARGAVLIRGRTAELRDRPYLEALMFGDEPAVKLAELPHAKARAAKDDA